MTDCPPKGDLRRFLEAAPESTKALDFAAHLENCPLCQRALDAILLTEYAAAALAEPGSGETTLAGRARGTDFLRGLEDTPPGWSALGTTDGGRGMCRRRSGPKCQATSFSRCSGAAEWGSSTRRGTVG